MATRPATTPPWRGKPRGTGIPKAEGVDPAEATLPADGRPKGEGRDPEDPATVLPGSPGQVPKGTPGTLEPWMENPWAPGGMDDEAWAAAPPPLDDGGGDDFYLSHPNYLDVAKDVAAAPASAKDDSDDPNKG